MNLETADTIPAPPCFDHKLSEDGFTCENCGDDITVKVDSDLIHQAQEY